MDPDYSLIKLNDFEVVFRKVLNDSKTAHGFTNKILLYNRKCEEGQNIDNLEQLLNLDVHVFSDIKGIGNSTEILIDFQKSFHELTDDHKRELIGEHNVVIPDLEEEYLQIRIVDINREYIPSLIRSKLNRNESWTLRDVLENRNYFIARPANHRAFQSFIDTLLTQKIKIKKDVIYSREGKSLLADFQDDQLYILRALDQILKSYLDLIKERDKIFIERYFGLVGNRSWDLAELADLYKVSRERVRQILADHLTTIKDILIGREIAPRRFKQFVYRPSIPDTLRSEFSQLFEDFNSQLVISRSSISRMLNEDYNSSAEDFKDGLIELLLALADFERVKVNVSLGTPGSKRFSKEVYYLFSKATIDADLFLKIANCIYDVLSESIVPMDEFEFLAEVCSRSDLSMKNREMVMSIVDLVPEFEVLENEMETDTSESDLIQLRFESLSNWPQRIVRVLHEVDTEQTLPELMDLLKWKADAAGIKLDINPQSIRSAINRSPQIVGHGKRGVYSLKAWELDPQTLEQMVVETLKEFNRPMRSVEISNEIIRSDRTVKRNSINTIISILNWNKILPVGGSRYILTDWKSKYKSELLPFAPQKDHIGRRDISKKRKAYEILKELKNRPINQNDFINVLVKQHLFRPGTASRVCQDTDYFVRSRNVKNRIVLDLVSNPPDETNGSRLEYLTEKALKILDKEPNRKMPLNKLVNIIHKEYLPHREKHNVYKVFYQEDIFQKIIEDENAFISTQPKDDQNSKQLHAIRTDTGQIYNWIVLKNVLKHELYDILYRSNQPVSQSDISFDELLDLYHKLLVDNIGKKLLDGMDESILPSVERYFQNPRDFHDSKVYLKDILISIESLLLKIIFFVNEDKFKEFDHLIRNGKGGVGLGKFISTLRRIDPGNFRRADSRLRHLPSSNYLREINRAYTMRNQIAHLGGDYKSETGWSTTDINEGIKSALVVQLYAVFLYRKELDYYL